MVRDRASFEPMDGSNVSCISRTLLVSVAALLSSLASPWVHSSEYLLPESGDGLFGEVLRVRTRYEDTLIQLARQYSLGYEELLRVNPGVDPWLPGEGTEVVIPGQRVLPPGERRGIVVNLPENRLYFFPKPPKGQAAKVYTYPVSVGKMDWRTPLGVTTIVSKRVNPTWTPPESVRRDRAARGERPLPRVVPPGPDNPLGRHAMRLGIPSGAYLIHGTNNPDAVGMAVTHGCLRMYPEDIARMFPDVPIGTEVALINEPVKLAKVGGEIWLEVHPPINEEGQATVVDLQIFEARLDELLGDSEVMINWDLAISALRESSGIPLMIGLELEPELKLYAPDVL